MEYVGLGLNLVDLQGLVEAINGLRRQRNTPVVEVQTSQIHMFLIWDLAILLVNGLAVGTQHCFEHTASSHDLIRGRSMDPNVVDINSVPFSPVQTQGVVQDVLEVRIPEDRHVGNTLSPTQILHQARPKLDHCVLL